MPTTQQMHPTSAIWTHTHTKCYETQEGSGLCKRHQVSFSSGTISFGRMSSASWSVSEGQNPNLLNTTTNYVLGTVLATSCSLSQIQSFIYVKKYFLSVSISHTFTEMWPLKYLVMYHNLSKATQVGKRPRIWIKSSWLQSSPFPSNTLPCWSCGFHLK